MQSKSQPKLRVRPIRVSDYDAVRDIFRLGVLDAKDSARNAAMKAQFRRWSTRLAIALMIIGLAITLYDTSSALAGLSVMVLSGVYFFVLVYQLRAHFAGFVSDALKGDMGDFAVHYKLEEDPDCDEDHATRPSGRNGFWVAEVLTENGYRVAGCIGLDETTATNGASEVRRMFVSPNFRRLGVAAALVKVLFAHAKQYQIDTLVLMTSEFQVVAREMYKKLGWVHSGSRQWKMLGGLNGVELLLYERKVPAKI